MKAGPQGLLNASKGGRLAVVLALLAAGADTEAKDTVCGEVTIMNGG